MSIQSNFPAIKPTLLLDFANTEQLDPRITFTRASTATYYGTQTAKAEENLVLYSQDLSQWTNQGVTLVSGKTAPDGTSTAFSVTAASGNQRIFISPSVVSGVIHTISVFMRRVVGTGTITFRGPSGVDTNVTAEVTSSWSRVVLTGTSSGSIISVVVGVQTIGDEIEVWGAQVEQRSAATAYTPTTTQPITNYIPVLQTAAAGVARFDHNPTTFESLGLLIEEQRTNLLTYSEQFDNAAWTKTNATITANTIVAPDGALTGDKLVEDTSTSAHGITESVSVTTGITYTISFYLKQAGVQYAAILAPTAVFGTGTDRVGRFDLLNGTIVEGTTAKISFVGNGWYRCAITVTAIATSSANFQLYTSTSTTQNKTGDGYSGIYIWGAQLESSSFSTSYIPTVASQVTRSADAASMTGTNFSSWYNQAAGTFYSESTVAQIGVLSITAALSDGTTSNRVQIQRTASNNFQDFVVSGSATQSSVSVSGVAANVSAKVASTYQVNSFQMAANATLGTEDTSGTVPVVDRLELGSRASSSFLNGTIRKVSYYPIRCTDAQLQAITQN